MNRAYYSDSISNFLTSDVRAILGTIELDNDFPSELTQRDAWLEEIQILQSTLRPYQGAIYFEYSIPRMGRRIDVVLLIGPVIFVLEFKVGGKEFPADAVDQVWDYALDLKNFHETSHDRYIAPILIATQANTAKPLIKPTLQHHDLLVPIESTVETLGNVVGEVLSFAKGPDIGTQEWESGRYYPTPTIIEAALALYGGHSVEEISRNDATAVNLGKTTDCISSIISAAKEKSHKAICFVTGVPGAGKTLVGLDIATTHMDKNKELYSVFLSGNEPLVKVLREALARDKVRRERERGRSFKKGKAMSEVRAFVQNVHHFRDECLIDRDRAPIEHVALFDEAQRAWDLEKTSDFMRRKKRVSNFNESEPEFLISCLKRHNDWAVVVCLVGGGQEINTGEAGISEWIESLNRSFPDWHIYISPRLTDSEYGAGEVLSKLATRPMSFIKTNCTLQSRCVHSAPKTYHTW
jgi:Schlafen group 3, DNA/RNA helicase domain